MKIDILGIPDRGIANKERLYLKVNMNTNLLYYLVCDSILVALERVSNLPRYSFWFPKKEVNAGDSVILYTKSGTDLSKSNPDGTSTHFFYWGLEKTIWNTPDDCAILFEINSWQTSKRGS